MSIRVYFAYMSQDFSRQNLRGRSFKNQNLEGANFSYADIRGTNFTGANFRRANFTGAKAGLQRHWAIFLVMISWLVSGLSGFLFLFNAAPILLIFDSSNISNQFAGWAALILMIIIFALIIRQRIATGAVAFTFTFAGALAGAVVIDIAGAIAGAVVVAVAVAGAVTGAVAGYEALVGARAGASKPLLGGADGALFDPLALVVFMAVIFVTVLAFAFAVAGAVISFYIAWEAMKGDEKYALVRSAAVSFATINGTSFRSADLTDADFTKAILKSTDLRKAKLTRTCFNKAKLLNRVRSGNSYLQH